MVSERRHVPVPELLALASVPALLVGVFLFPSRAAYALSYAEPTLLTAFTMHFVHVQFGHLLANFLVYLLVVPVTYLHARRANRQDLFWTAFLTFLLVLPFALSGLNLLFDRPRVGFGFSGINMAFLGLLALLLTTGAGHRPGQTSSLRHAPGMFFAVTGLIAALTVPDPWLRLGIAAAAVLAACLYLPDLGGSASISARLDTALRSDGFELTAIGLGVFLLVPVAAFPSTPVQAGSVLNLYTHFLGYGLGFIAPYATAAVLEVDLRPGSRRSEIIPVDVQPIDAD